MPWKFNDSLPVYLQIMDEVKQRVLTGVYKPGDRLPSVRELAIEAAVNPNTMQRALAELEKENIIYSERTSGRFVTDDMELIGALREGFVQENIKALVTKLEGFGFTKADILQLTRQFIEQEEKNVNSRM